jgi:hypothetical protein
VVRQEFALAVRQHDRLELLPHAAASPCDMVDQRLDQDS